jgi:hypothetical protein
MDTRHLLEDNWEYVLQMLPAKWEQIARDTKAVQRSLRGIPNLESLMRLLLMHLGLGYSLRETAARGKVANIAHVSDVALLKHLRKCPEFFRQLCLLLLNEQQGAPPAFLMGGIPVRLVDATHVKEPGKTGSVWRLHTALKLANLECDHFEITPTAGKGTGEDFTHIPIQVGECLMGDRGYARVPGLAYVNDNKGFSLVRIVSTFPMENVHGERIVLLNLMRTLKKPEDCGEWEVFLRHEGRVIAGRLCAVHKSQEAVEKAERKLKRRDQKQQQRVLPETIELARYMMLFTSIPNDKLTLKEVLELYRYRWQIELLFKRFKSLAQLGHLPKHEKESAKAWLYGKLLIILLTEKAIVMAKKFSPGGTDTPGQAVSQSVA